MVKYSLSLRADLDLEHIYSEGWNLFGEKQAELYYDGLIDLFKLLAASPKIGRKLNPRKPSLRMHSYKSHVVYYREEKDGILIVRVLHGAMNRP
ncbi:MAG: type II toxin-antitoxin system RelE/ParE family toxin [Candidatus Symbiobacter sp.]|nr:type II toxin-antitoxin system RelE/ParE family toxin [Candidatus Symbiobacter sp.]